MSKPVIRPDNIVLAAVVINTHSQHTRSLARTHARPQQFAGARAHQHTKDLNSVINNTKKFNAHLSNIAVFNVRKLFPSYV